MKLEDFKNTSEEIKSAEKSRYKPLAKQLKEERNMYKELAEKTLRDNKLLKDEIEKMKSMGDKLKSQIKSLKTEVQVKKMRVKQTVSSSCQTMDTMENYVDIGDATFRLRDTNEKEKSINVEDALNEFLNNSLGVTAEDKLKVFTYKF